ncbi:unnamed protein product [Caenorhabditis angaria]|uniref:Uncharacterized protein n=1 Tax=Caenorhabditis angaria TaxID=860376 RepID=A0A9P1IUJ9_9PELO|nr:unnamed protein product [Caenorhabditis angaria]
MSGNLDLLEQLFTKLEVAVNKTRPKSCGCANKCLVEITFSSQTFKTRSLQIAAGITVKIVYQRQNNYEQVFKVSPFVAVEKIYSLYYQALTFRQQPFVAGKSLSQHGVVDGSVIYSR